MSKILMTEPRWMLLYGDPYRCESALEDREKALASAHPSIERHPRFAEEVDIASLDIESQSSALFATARHFVIRHIDRVRATKPWISWMERELPPETFVTLLGADLKATNALVKAMAQHGRSVSLPAPSSRSAGQSVRAAATEAGLRLSKAGIETLAERTGGELFAVKREIEKLRIYARNHPIADRDVEALTFSGIEQTAYPFFDRLGNRNLPDALRTLDELREDPGRLLSGAVRHLTRLTTLRLLVDRHVAQNRMAATAGLQDWLTRRLLPQAKRFSLDEATAALDLGIRLDAQVKSGGIQALDALLKLLLAVATPLPTTR
jgi:DNA polymerase III delta subunit